MYYLIFLYFLFRSFYILSSGSLQIFDLFFIINLVLFFIKRYEIKEEIKKILTPFLNFVVWVSAVNLIWVIIDNGEIGYIRTIIYYIYNFLFTGLNLCLYKMDREKYKACINNAFLINVLMNLFIYFSKTGRYLGHRDMLFFNDPNQMAYYFFTVILISTILNLKNKIIISIISSFLILASLSRGGTGSLVIFCVLYFLSKIDFKKLKIFTIMKLALFIAAFVFFFRDSIQAKLDSTLTRFSEKSENSSVAARGWERIEKYPHYLIIGAGEGGVTSGKKFAKARGATLETHSTWANFLLSYGVAGMLLFMVFNLRYINLKKYFPHYFAILAHGMIQVDSRRTTFWLILTLMIYNSYLEKRRRNCAKKKRLIEEKIKQ